MANIFYKNTKFIQITIITSNTLYTLTKTNKNKINKR